MSIPSVSVKELFDAGVHFGHHVRRWNPQMSPYIFGVKDKIHIIDLDQTVKMFNAALKVAHDVAASGGKFLFVGTKRQASQRIIEAAERCGQFYVNHRWLGGMLTNWKTVSKSIKKLEMLESKLSEGVEGLKKKEALLIDRQRMKLEKTLGGVRSMDGEPSLLFVIDITIEDTAVLEARKLGIPVIGICDTNSDYRLVDYPIPGNDDSSKAIDLYCRLMENAVLSGLHDGLTSVGVDVGAFEQPADIIGDSDASQSESQDVAE